MATPLDRMTLRTAWREIVYVVSCNDCRRSVRIDLRTMAERLGEAFLVNDLRGRLRCSTCGRRERGQMTWASWWLSGTTALEPMRRWPMPYDEEIKAPEANLLSGAEEGFLEPPNDGRGP